MKRHIQVRISAVACLLAMFAFSTTLSAVVNHVTACGTVITVAGTWVLDNDLTCSGRYINGIDIETSNVTLMLQNHNIFGPTTGYATGVLVATATGEGVRNVNILGPGSIQNFLKGVVFKGTIGGSVASIFFRANSSVGIYLITDADQEYSSGLLISQNELINGGDGIDADGLTNSTIIGNLPHHNARNGILLYVGTSNTISGNFAENNGNGITIGGGGSGRGATSNTIQGNRTQSNSGAGIYSRASGASQNKFSANSAFFNTVVDIFDENSSCDSDTYSLDVFATSNQSCIQ